MGNNPKTAAAIAGVIAAALVEEGIGVAIGVEVILVDKTYDDLAKDDAQCGNKGAYLNQSWAHQ